MMVLLKDLKGEILSSDVPFLLTSLLVYHKFESTQNKSESRIYCESLCLMWFICHRKILEIYKEVLC